MTLRHAVLLLALVTRLISAQDASFPSPHLQHRQSSTSNLINPATQPNCAWSTCWHNSSPPPELCPLVFVPCAENSGDPDESDTKCGTYQYEQSCYCSLKAPLKCAFDLCAWSLWYATEDWFAKVCPSSQALKLDFSGLPECASNCFDDATFQYGCLTQTSNCFCSRGDLFKCHENCHKDSEYKQIENWLQDACGLSAETATQALESGSFSVETTAGTSSSDENAAKRVGPSAPKPRRPLKWNEKFIIVVLVFTFIAGVVMWLQRYFMEWNLKKFKQNEGKLPLVR